MNADLLQVYQRALRDCEEGLRDLDRLAARGRFKRWHVEAQWMLTKMQREDRAFIAAECEPWFSNEAFATA